MKSILPHDEAFFESFDALCATMVEAAEILQNMLKADGQEEDQARRLKQVEARADDVVHKSLNHLHRTFVTPIDREDIHKLVVTLDDVVDLMEGAGARIHMYAPKAKIDGARQLARVLIDSTHVLQQMVSQLRQLKGSNRILDLAVEINRLENEGDGIRRGTVSRLFREEKDPFELIKWKEILDFLEEATDRCEDVSDVLEGIVLENT